MSKNKTLIQLRIGDSFQIRKDGRAYTIHDKVSSNPMYDEDRKKVFSSISRNHYVVCIGPQSRLYLFDEDKRVILLSRGEAHD